MYERKNRAKRKGLLFTLPIYIGIWIILFIAMFLIMLGAAKAITYSVTAIDKASEMETMQNMLMSPAYYGSSCAFSTYVTLGDFIGIAVTSGGSSGSTIHLDYGGPISQSVPIDEVTTCIQKFLNYAFSRGGTLTGSAAAYKFYVSYGGTDYFTIGSGGTTEFTAWVPVPYTTSGNKVAVIHLKR